MLVRNQCSSHFEWAKNADLGLHILFFCDFIYKKLQMMLKMFLARPLCVSVCCKFFWYTIISPGKNILVVAHDNTRQLRVNLERKDPKRYKLRKFSYEAPWIALTSGDTASTPRDNF